MTKYASGLPDFPDLLKVSAQSRNLPAAIVEKDYYLTRALRALAEGHSGQFILKGGTSLSKGWQLLQRLSEDIDLLVRDEPSSGEQARHTRLKKCAKTIAHTEGFESETVLNSETGVHRKVSFNYSSMAHDLPQLGRTVILEAGYRGNAAEAVARTVQSMLAEFAATKGYADLASDLGPFEIEVQSLLRTFVEKLFAAHAAFVDNYAAGKTRHYYHLYEMCRLPEVRAFVGTGDYRKCVSEVRKVSEETFKGQALPESESFAASPAFQPDPNGARKLEQNYSAEADLFFTVQPSMKDVLQTIGELLPKL